MSQPSSNRLRSKQPKADQPAQNRESENVAYVPNSQQSSKQKHGPQGMTVDSSVCPSALSRSEAIAVIRLATKGDGEKAVARLS